MAEECNHPGVLMCACCTDLSVRYRVHHRAFQRWYDNRNAGNVARAFVWGRIADAALIGT